MALDAIKGIKTIREIAADSQVHPTQVTQWKSQMLAGASEVFEQALRVAGTPEIFNTD